MIDLLVVGGGAAGIGAALAARERKLDVLLLEAGERLGGRARTIEWRGHRLDLGCGWLHSAERNPWVGLAEETGREIDRSPATWNQQYRDLGFSADEQAAAAKTYDAWLKRLAELPASDRASDALEPGAAWNAYVDALSGYLNGATLDRLSAADFLAYDQAASENNWRLPRGYGALIAGAGAAVPTRTGVTVKAISRLPAAVQVETAVGTLTAAHVIVTVSTAALPRIRFDPPLREVQEAASDLPLGVADKLFLSLEGAEEFPADAHLLADPRRRDSGSYMLRPMGMPVIEGFFGGCGAVAIERAGLAEAAALARDELSALLGSGFGQRLAPIALSRWAAEPLIGGSYSHALPGRAAARKQLREAGDERLAFAGEATSAHDFSTAHGAYESGIAAVSQLFA